MLENEFDCIPDVVSRIHASRVSEISTPASNSVFFFWRILIGNSREPTRIKVRKLKACSLSISSMISEADSCSDCCFMRVLPLASTNAVDVTLSSKLSIILILKSRGSCHEMFVKQLNRCLALFVWGRKRCFQRSVKSAYTIASREMIHHCHQTPYFWRYSSPKQIWRSRTI